MRVLFFVLLLLFPFVPTGFAAEGDFICPMHPHISGEEGDTCPICGMALVPKAEEVSEEQSHSDHKGEMSMSGTIQISPTYVQALGVKTTEAIHHKFGKNIRAFGALSTSTREEYAINLQSEGWVKTLNTDAVGDVVKQGDVLFTLYSQEIMGAQSDFLVGGRGNPEQKLKLVGMDAQAIALLKQKRRMMEETPFHAPADGIITELNIRKGSFVPKGGLALTIQDFSKMWANIDVSERDIGFLKIGTPVTITIPGTGQEYESTIDYIHPVNDQESRTVTVRVILDNSENTLKANAYVDALFEADVAERLAVPKEAVLYGKNGAYVMEDLGEGRFKPVMIEAGITSNGFTEIISGLSHGQSIVQSGQFMLDAESNLKGGMSAMGHDHGSQEMTGMAHDQNNAEEGRGHVH